MKILSAYNRLIILSVVLAYAFMGGHAQNVDHRLDGRRGCRPASVHNERNNQSFRAKSAGETTNKFVGQRRQLTVLAAFNDKQFLGDEQATLLQWDKIFNAENYNEEPFVGSVSDYFRDQSYNQFDIKFDLLYVALEQPCSRYRSTSTNDENSQFLVNDIMDSLLNRDIDWSQYDWDGDGFIDQLLIVYAGKGMNDGGDRNTIWPHQSWLTEHTDVRTGEKLKPRTVDYDGKVYSVDCYCAVQEISGKGTYGTFGTICHEFSHCFGFPDIYYGEYSYVYDWDLMDSGNFNGNGFCPPGYSAQERMLMGWLTPVELTEASSIEEMAALGDEPVAYIIRNDGHTDEYYILENRQQKGWDKELPSSGLLVLHVDYYHDEWTGISYSPNIPANYWNGYAEQKHYYIIPANNSPYLNRYTLQEWPYPYRENNMLTNTSTPAAMVYNENADGSLFMSKPLTNIRVDNGLAAFDFMQADDGICHTTPHIQTGKVIYEMGPIQFVRTDEGKVVKTIRPLK